MTRHNILSDDQLQKILAQRTIDVFGDVSGDFVDSVGNGDSVLGVGGELATTTTHTLRPASHAPTHHRP